MKIIISMMVLLVTSALTSVNAATWTPLGLSGGGALFTPAISPVDPRLMLVNCDMSAAYITRDGGANWQMIPYSQLRSSTRCKPAFHPTDPKVLFAASGGEGLRVSRDAGQSWSPIGKGLPGNLQGEIAIHPLDPGFMLAGAEDAAYRSHDGGNTWAKCDGPQGTVLTFHFDRTDPAHRRCFVGTEKGIWKSEDGCETWSPCTMGLPSTEISSFAGGSNEQTGKVIVYCTLLRSETTGLSGSGIYCSTDRGASWQAVKGGGLNLETQAFDEWAMGPVANYSDLVTSDAQPGTVYAFNTNTGIPPPHHTSAYKSMDGGETWRSTFQGDPRFPGMNVEADYTVVEDGQFYQEVPLGVAGNPNDPNLLVAVDSAHLCLTRDGGKTWVNGHTRRAEGNASKPATWVCNGLVVTSTWNYYVDPFDAARRYICYTDLGFAHSSDRGKTWSWWSLKGRARWSNTCYQLAFDPDIPGKAWGAFSDTHDIPNDNIISGRHRSNLPGGVCLTLDHCDTWTPIVSGLPKAPCTAVVVDPKSPLKSRTLYAGFFGFGVYRSDDDGKTWTAKNNGLGTEENRRVCRIALHKDGALFALVTALKKDGKFQNNGAGLYRSKDKGETWEKINRTQPLLWPKDVTVDPTDSRILYVGACDTNGEENGGLYRTRDGGETWQRLARRGPEHFGAYLSPYHPGWIYMTLCEGAPDGGLWLSKDDGKTWTALNGLPFSNAQRVAFDPDEKDSIFVTTFGGSVWKGPADFGF